MRKEPEIPTHEEAARKLAQKEEEEVKHPKVGLTGSKSGPSGFLPGLESECIQCPPMPMHNVMNEPSVGGTKLGSKKV